MSTKTHTRRVPTRGRKTTTSPGRPTRRTTAPTTGKAGVRTRAPRIPFVLLVMCLMGGALISLLVLRSVVAQEAYAITSLQSQNKELSQREQQLQREVAHLETSERIAREAEQMGMRQGQEPLFLDPDNGEVTGGTE